MTTVQLSTFKLDGNRRQFLQSHLAIARKMQFQLKQ
jgi:hypothetical protein